MILGELCNFAGPFEPSRRSFWRKCIAHRCHSVRLRRSDRRRQFNFTPFPCPSRLDHRSLTSAFQTPLGALSVVISAVLSSIFLKEKLTFFGWLGCALCVVRLEPAKTSSGQVRSVDPSQAWLYYYRSQWTHGRFRRSDTRVSKIVSRSGVCSVRKRHDYCLDCYCALRCP